MDQNSVMPNPAASVQDATPARGGAADVVIEVANKIFEAKNVLVALSSDPSVDEMAAAIGLTLYLDRLDKRATAIYSGTTPNALEFLKPEETFEPTADTLQDFVIALNKEKADHLRYKLDGEYVKIYITPYKAKISEKDLEFSYGDYNVDLVLALDVANGADLDSALREHGRIMHDAVVINITTGNPGKFGEIEWSDKKASSVSEMIARLLYSVNTEARIEKDDATAFLTGIVAATNRFSSANTTPETMQIASRLMESGANQQLVSKNITPEVENELYAAGSKAVVGGDIDPTKLKIKHEKEDEVQTPEAAGAAIVGASGETKNDEEATSDSKIADNIGGVEAESELMNDLKMAAESLSHAGSEAVPEAVEQPVKIESNEANAAAVESELNADFSGKVMPSEGTISESNTMAGMPVMNEPALPPVVMPDINIGTNDGVNTIGAQPAVGVQDNVATEQYAEKVVQPPVGDAVAPVDNDASKYGKMLKDTLAAGGDVTSVSESGSAFAEPKAGADSIASGTSAINTEANPASMMAPQVPSGPEVNGVPEMNYMPLPGQEVLPPPPTPPIDMGVVPPSAPTTPAAELSLGQAAGDAMVMPDVVNSNTPVAEAEKQPASLGAQPAMQDQVYTPQAVDPGAFKIPGM